jgi:hypothetical protein
MTTETAQTIQLFAPRQKAGKKFPVRVMVSADRPKSGAQDYAASPDTAENQRLRRHDRANMHTFLFRSYDLIVQSDEADLVRDVCFNIDRAQTKLKGIRRRLQGVHEEAAAKVQLPTAADTKLTAAIVAALLSTRRGNSDA